MFQGRALNMIMLCLMFPGRVLNIIMFMFTVSEPWNIDLVFQSLFLNRFFMLSNQSSTASLPSCF